MQRTPSGIPRHPALGIDDIHTPADVWASQEAQDTAASNAEVGGPKRTHSGKFDNDYITEVRRYPRSLKLIADYSFIQAVWSCCLPSLPMRLSIVAMR